MKKTIILLLSLAIAFAGYSQDDTAIELNDSDLTEIISMNTDTIKGITQAAVPGKITVVKDARIDKVSKDLAGGTTNKSVMKGYRIQIISSSTKSVVDGERGRFMTANPGVANTTDYKAPNFKLLVGNFRTKLDAEKFQNEIKDQFPGTIIIADEIDLPKLD